MPRPVGGFDFFGMQNTQKEKTSAAALEPAQLASVQNEDLADVVGAEAIAAHRAEAAVSAAGLGPEDSADDSTDDSLGTDRGVGQVIDLTEHDETEQIDVGVLRTAIS